MNQYQDTAILLFSRTADKEARQKNWTQEPELNYRIASHLIRRTKKHLARASLAVFHIDESKQIGYSFGERLSNAFRYVFDRGYKNVICVGNDCQNLQISWNEIVNKLKSGKTVLGPDQRGGIYLLGISSNAPIASILEKIQWNTSYVFEELCNRINNIFVLETRRDTNTFKDIKTDKELNNILKTFRAKAQNETKNTIIVSDIKINQKPLRAPPFLN
jgi:glycosyltransferase A (GT-A) superfamily protein (DUF2064 family)